MSILNAFINGSSDQFTSEWVDYVPLETRAANPELQRLEFMVQVYFALYPLIHPAMVSHHLYHPSYETKMPI